jgi:NADH-quinone oxidoreductase subunit G
MADLVNVTIDGRQLQAPPGSLVIDVAKRAGIEIPAFCYYEGLSLQAACRMCLVEVEKAPKLLAACTLPVTEGMVVKTDTPQVVTARKSMLEMLLTNHPLDCPVCDKGGECELQDMAFRYGVGESRFTEMKHHVDEKQFSSIVFFDAPRCILCYRCVRICGEGLGVGALGVSDRGVRSEILPSHGDHLECDECGACIDICPVGALTSSVYRYQTRPWEMNHVGTICTHCSNGCKTTLGVRNNQIIRGNNRDRSGINGEFLCIKGRYGFDFIHSEERLLSPMLRANGELQPVSWSRALLTVAQKFNEIRERGGKVGVIGSNHTTNEENYYLQRFAREVLHTNSVDHHRTGDVATLIDALAGKQNALASMADLYTTRAAVVIGADLAQQHPLVHFQLRSNHRHHGAHVYSITEGPVRERKYAHMMKIAEPARQLDELEALRSDLSNEPELVILFGDTVKGEGVRRLVAFGDSLGIPIRYVCLMDYSNSRGASDMGLLPDLGAGYQPVAKPGLTWREMLEATDLDLLWVVGSNPMRYGPLRSENAFVVVQEMFMTETARRADVIFPAAASYEKEGTFTNVTGEVQQLRRALKTMGTKPDLEIFGLLAKEMGVKTLPAASAQVVFEEIRKSVRGYNVALPVIRTGGAAQAMPLNGRIPVTPRPEMIWSNRDTLFTSGSLGRYSRNLNSTIEKEKVRLYDSGVSAP